MQEELIKRAKELLADGTVARVLGWKAGDLPYNPEPSYFENEDQLKNFVYNGFCGANLSKYMIEASKLEGKTLVFLKPCDTYSFNQLIKEHRVDREKALCKLVHSLREFHTFSRRHPLYSCTSVFHTDKVQHGEQQCHTSSCIIITCTVMAVSRMASTHDNAVRTFFKCS